MLIFIVVSSKVVNSKVLYSKVECINLYLVNMEDGNALSNPYQNHLYNVNYIDVLSIYAFGEWLSLSPSPFTAPYWII